MREIKKLVRKVFYQVARVEYFKIALPQGNEWFECIIIHFVNRVSIGKSNYELVRWATEFSQKRFFREYVERLRLTNTQIESRNMYSEEFAALAKVHPQLKRDKWAINELPKKLTSEQTNDTR